MKKTLFLLLLGTAMVLPVFSQYIIVPNSGFLQLSEVECPYNSEADVMWLREWKIYQTLDDTWDGPIDSTRCISIQDSGNYNSIIDLQQIDPDRALFIRQTLSDEIGLLRPDFAYNFNAQIRLSDSDTLSIGSLCSDDLCSGAIGVVEIPDENGTGKIQRINTSNFSSINGYSTVQNCFVTEYFDENILREVILKFSFSDEVLDGELTLYGMNVESPVFEVNPVQEVVFPPSTFSGESYSANLIEVVQPEAFVYDEAPFIFLHDPAVYPTIGNVTFIEARPEIATEEPLNLRANFEGYQSVFFQPYTGIRGALVDPEDTLRHRFTLVGENMDICFPTVVELVVGDGAEVEFRSGNIHFGGPTSCIMLRDGGAIVIPDHTRFTYGDGVGALGLDKGGTIRIGQGSELIINNTAILPNYIDGPDQQVYMELHPGSRLTFGEQSRLIRKGHVEDGQMLLNVYMKGGILDDSRLSARDRRLINRIYPENADNSPDWLRILGNPLRNELTFSVDIQLPDTPVSWRIKDLNGRSLKSGQFIPMAGLNQETINLGSISGGMYLLEVQQLSEKVVDKFILLR